MGNTKFDNYAIEAATKAAHEANRAFCEVLGDYSHKHWEDTPEELRQVARQATINIAENDYNARQSHEAWVAAKRAAGWNHGDQKDADKKLHPCLVSYDDLPFEQAAKDELWVANVKSLLKAIWHIPRQ